MADEIRIEDLANVDFDDVAVAGATDVPPTRPGDILLHDFMEPLGMSSSVLGRDLAVPANRISAVLAGTRCVSADTALRLARYFGTSPELWMGLQTSYNLRKTARSEGDAIARQAHPRAA